MDSNFAILLLGVDPARPGIFAVLRDAGMIATSCPAELQAAWNHIATHEPADLVIVSPALQRRQGCPIALTDVVRHLRKRWPDTPILAVHGAADSGFIARFRELGVDDIQTGVAEGDQLASLVESNLERLLDHHIKALNEQHIQLAMAFRKLQQNCSLEQQRGLTQQLLDNLESHFHFEERFMANHGYERRHEHAAGHARMLVKAKAAINACRLRDTAAAAAAWQQVRSELDTHIRDDQAYLGFLEEMRQALTVQLQQPAVAV